MRTRATPRFFGGVALVTAFFSSAVRAGGSSLRSLPRKCSIILLIAGDGGPVALPDIGALDPHVCPRTVQTTMDFLQIALGNDNPLDLVDRPRSSPIKVVIILCLRIARFRLLEPPFPRHG